MSLNPEFRRVAARDTHSLRDAVLRPGLPPGGSIYPGDDAPDTLHLGAFVGDTIAAIATLCRESMPDQSTTTSWRLRGMATLPEYRGRGSASSSHDARSPMPSNKVAPSYGAARVPPPYPSIEPLASRNAAMPFSCRSTATSRTFACSVSYLDASPNIGHVTSVAASIPLEDSCFHLPLQTPRLTLNFFLLLLGKKSRGRSTNAIFHLPYLY